ncbi:MAG TPA: response regulator [Candidatus Baltobacteraceae bacterium]|nr:response regulator [Candidatus Baltobacteraceae bacterium]
MQRCQRPAPDSEKRRRILVVDDQWTNIQKIGSLLGGLGHEIIPALDGPQALDRASNCAPDLVLLDLIMPGMDGCEVCRRLRKTAEGSRIPVIFISAVDDKEMIVRALAAGGVDYITKPFNSGELLRRVITQLSLKSARDDLRQLLLEKNELLGMLTHDLKSLLGGINLSADLARDRLAQMDDPSPHKLAADIFDASGLLLLFVKRFLATANATDSADGNAEPARAARILVADDQPENIQLLGATLGRLGHEIIPATDGVTAVKRVKLKEPDLILLDLLMPGIDGFETCRRLRATPQGRDCPVIFLSSVGDKGFIVRALEAGAVDYLTKPFNLEELVLRVQTHLSLKFTQDRLGRLVQTRDLLLASLTDDFKKQLETMCRNARSLREQACGLEDQRVEQLIDNIFRSSAQLLDFVTGFLDLAADGKNLALHPAPLSFCQAVKRTVKRYAEPARVKGVRLLLDPPPAADDDLVLADKQAIDRVLDNLVSNAVKFSPAKTVVRLSVQSTGCQVQCRIADQGPGFTAEDNARMFRRFGRLSARPTGGEPSTGLGLSIVRKLTEAMNGDVTCQSAPGQGAVFTIGLPRARAGLPQY